MKRIAARRISLLLGVLALGSTADASTRPQQALTIALEPGAAVQRLTNVYRCRLDRNGASLDEIGALQAMLPSGPFRVEYINTDDIHLAIAPVNGRTHVMTEVISADGGKYTVDAVTWWTRGNEARFTSEMGQTRAAMICTTQP
jgi:hypothetical protein